jgi:hypothetical protein
MCNLHFLLFQIKIICINDLKIKIHLEMNQGHKIGLKFFVLLFFISFVEAQDICVDFYLPFAPGSFYVSGFAENVTLQWDAAKDKPDCGEVNYYNVYRDKDKIGETYNLSFNDLNVTEGSYAYSVSAVDKAGHEGAWAERRFKVDKRIFNLSNNSSNITGVINLKNKNKTSPASNFTVFVKSGGNESDSNLSSSDLYLEDDLRTSGLTGAFLGVFSKMDALRITLLIMVIIFMVIILFLRIWQAVRSGK